MRGWIFYEMEEDLRTQLPEIKQLEFAVRSSAGEVQIVKVDYPKEGEEFPVMSSGTWEIQKGHHDLTQHYTLCQRIDLHKILKGEKAIVIQPRKKK